eukprot:TRINITY_DN79717_c0_g1_i1.p1 TRINITY_DN79717_c0_g1~~TRINITY_DN79717_c0_g1_i1.p1  ORF type:complete len:152 (-),score=4.67 TRINITY_DN79717_c0_g1_i1:43-498(-)
MKYILDWLQENKGLKTRLINSNTMMFYEKKRALGNRNALDQVEAILNCKYFISGALHGVIVADVYGVPSILGTFSNHSIAGKHFKGKFVDYAASVRRPFESLDFDTLDTPEKVWDRVQQVKAPTLHFNVQELLEATPFLAPVWWNMACCAN